jgi:hypothetical protein
LKRQHDDIEEGETFNLRIFEKEEHEEEEEEEEEEKRTYTTR